ncbi:pyruvate kinase [Planctomyces sp. SH-PL62]|uniref:pyruvate kinase n=1 Tax=Planctomyces sp. SH-PL62 TaxID=1636152 RepID=UPI00078C0B5C|nr:pyruvate kinase [Planctomyces sp. SH-PL62]AMV35920.1 Pyruvate kinase [Planctomyces sp. SH-PL62]
MTVNQVEPVGKVRTKIVATVGPASRDPAMLRRLVEAGVDVFRLNFSHGSHEEHSRTFQAIQDINREMGRQVAVLQDLCGPKIRLGTIAGDVAACDLDAEFVLTSNPISPDDPRELTCTYQELADDLEIGQTVLFADGTVGMVVLEKRPGWVRMKVTLPGRIRSNQGINVPGAALSVSALTPKDLADLEWTANHAVSYVGLSFVRHAADVTRLRAELQTRGSRARIIAKIEKPQAVANLESIVAEADGVMVARGDLGVEIDVAKVPAVQKRIIEICHRARVPVITATQMLNSMESSSRPTRAEASDVFNAVLDGSDAVMLSGETAIGMYPVDAVTTMSQIAYEAENLVFSRSHSGRGGWPMTAETCRDCPCGPSGTVARAGQVLPITEAVVEAASQVAATLRARLMVVATHSGRTALALSKQRAATPTLALTDDQEVALAMALYWGVTALHIPEIFDTGQVLAFADEWCRQHDLIDTGDRLVVVRGVIPDNPNHNAILVHEVE